MLRRGHATAMNEGGDAGWMRPIWLEESSQGGRYAGSLGGSDGAEPKLA